MDKQRKSVSMEGLAMDAVDIYQVPFVPVVHVIYPNIYTAAYPDIFSSVLNDVLRPCQALHSRYEPHLFSY